MSLGECFLSHTLKGSHLADQFSLLDQHGRRGVESSVQYVLNGTGDSDATRLCQSESQHRKSKVGKGLVKRSRRNEEAWGAGGRNTEVREFHLKLMSSGQHFCREQWECRTWLPQPHASYNTSWVLTAGDPRCTIIPTCVQACDQSRCESCFQNSVRHQAQEEKTMSTSQQTFSMLVCSRCKDGTCSVQFREYWREKKLACLLCVAW